MLLTGNTAKFRPLLYHYFNDYDAIMQYTTTEHELDVKQKKTMIISPFQPAILTSSH